LEHGRKRRAAGRNALSAGRRGHILFYKIKKISGQIQMKFRTLFAASGENMGFGARFFGKKT